MPGLWGKAIKGVGKALKKNPTLNHLKQITGKVNPSLIGLIEKMLKKLLLLVKNHLKLKPKK